MSGIVGTFRRGGAPVDRALLESVTDFLVFRGPDRRETWADGPVGFGHTLLRTTYESMGERQPASLGAQLCVTADARLDCRAELEADLGGAECKVRPAAPDSELILHAYAAWGEDCVQHLRGDFAFAIWDARRKTLFCARDHFGVKPFYYAEIGDLFFFSNTLDCVRLHPDVSGELNDAAVADFLLFGLNYDVGSTTFRDIRRLPPAHFLSVSADKSRTQRYWSAPVDGHIRYRHSHEYVEHFQVVLKQAVADRLRINRAGIWLSGGLDSSSIASVARELSPKNGGATDLRAYTVVYDSLIPDQEGARAGEVAEFLGIPQRFFPMDDIPLFDRWDDPKMNTPEPVDDPFFAGLFDQTRMIAQDCRVALGGEGSDNLMHFQMWPYTRSLLRNRQWRRLFTDMPRFLRRRQFPWRGIRRRTQRAFGKDPDTYKFPEWIAPDFARQVDIKARWDAGRRYLSAQSHPLIPVGHASLSIPQWPRYFELQDPGVTRFPVEIRHPFMDLRVVNYLLAIPPFPWAFKKTLLREAMVGRIPESVRTRPKTPLQAEPLVEMLQQPETGWVDRARWCEEIAGYVNPSAIPALHGERGPALVDLAIRPLCLNFWLQSKRIIRYKLKVEAHSV